MPENPHCSDKNFIPRSGPWQGKILQSGYLGEFEIKFKAALGNELRDLGGFDSWQKSEISLYFPF